MLLHDGPLRAVELAGFVEDGVGYAELAEVVEECGAMEELSAVGVEAEGLAESGRDVCDADGVAEGEVRFGVDHLGKSLADEVDV